MPAMFMFIASLSEDAVPRGPMCRRTLEIGSRMGRAFLDEVRLAAEIVDGLAFLRGELAARERRFQKLRAGGFHLLLRTATSSGRRSCWTG